LTTGVRAARESASPGSRAFRPCGRKRPEKIADRTFPFGYTCGRTLSKQNLLLIKEACIMKRKGGLSLDLLRVSIGAFFVLLGLYGILPTVEESVFSLVPKQGYGVAEIFFGIVELVCGVLILLSMFTFLPKQVKQISSLLIFIFWCARVIISKFILELQYMATLDYFSQWLLVLAAQLVIAAALWIFYRNSDL
jgi:hypothetical protein